MTTFKGGLLLWSGRFSWLQLDQLLPIELHWLSSAPGAKSVLAADLFSFDSQPVQGHNCAFTVVFLQIQRQGQANAYFLSPLTRLSIIQRHKTKQFANCCFRCILVMNSNATVTMSGQCCGGCFLLGSYLTFRYSLHGTSSSTAIDEYTSAPTQMAILGKIQAKF